MKTIQVRWIPFTVLQVSIGADLRLYLSVDDAKRLIHPEVLRDAQQHSNEWRTLDTSMHECAPFKRVYSENE